MLWAQQEQPWVGAPGIHDPLHQAAPVSLCFPEALTCEDMAGTFREGDEIKAVFSPKLVLSHHGFTGGFFRLVS